MTCQKSLNILLSPLDWGLGHTTRCVPLISYMQSLGHVVTFAGNDWQRRYIKETFPAIDTIHLDGYNVHYSAKAGGFMFTLFKQMPGLLKTIRNEHKTLQQICEAHKFEAIISDNRYGFYHDNIPSVIMTHQVLAQTGISDFMDNLLKQIHYRRLQRFNQCWVIDMPGHPNLSGKLGHPKRMPGNARFLGLLSQITPQQGNEDYLMVLLSGPEPQRTLLSDILWAQVQDYKGKVVFVEGSDIKVRQSKGDIIYHTRLTKEKLEPLLTNAKMVICRSGYSTLMDLVALNKKAILIPTPGQTEQEYLAGHLHKEGVFYNGGAQQAFDLDKSLQSAKGFPFKKPSLTEPFSLYKTVVKDWLDSI